MVEKRRGLGRGLGALIPSAPVDEPAPVGHSARGTVGRPADLFFEASRKAQDGDQDPAPKEEPGAGAQPSSTRSKARSPRTSVPSLRTGLVAPRPATPDVPPSGEVSRETETLAGVANDSRGTQGSANSNKEFKPPGAALSESPAFPRMHGAEAEAEAAPVVPGADENVSVKTLIPAESRSRGGEPELLDVPGARFAELPVDSIHANRKQPRQEFDSEELAELVYSIREVGVLQPIVVRPSTEGGKATYELVMGERRWRATREAGLGTVPAIIRLTTDDDLLRDALLENLHRSSLNPLEEAAAYQQLLDDFGCSHEELSGRIGRSRPQISNTLRLMKLPPLVQRRVAAGILSAGHARALLGLVDQAEMERLAQRIVAEGLSVRSTEEIVAMSGGLRRPAKAANPRAGARHERLDYLATSLSDRLDTSVKITLGARKGKVSIEFASVDDLNRIMTVLAPPES